MTSTIGSGDQIVLAVPGMELPVPIAVDPGTPYAVGDRVVVTVHDDRQDKVSLGGGQGAGRTFTYGFLCVIGAGLLGAAYVRRRRSRIAGAG